MVQNTPFGNQRQSPKGQNQNQNIQIEVQQGNKTNHKQNANNGNHNKQLQNMQKQLQQQNEHVQMLSNTLKQNDIEFPMLPSQIPKVVAPPSATEDAKVAHELLQGLIANGVPENELPPQLTARANAKNESNIKPMDISEIRRKLTASQNHLEKRKYEVNKCREWYKGEVVKCATVTQEVADLEKLMEQSLATQGFSKTIQISETISPPTGITEEHQAAWATMVAAQTAENTQQQQQTMEKHIREQNVLRDAILKDKTSNADAEAAPPGPSTAAGLPPAPDTQNVLIPPATPATVAAPAIQVKRNADDAKDAEVLSDADGDDPLRLSPEEFIEATKKEHPDFSQDELIAFEKAHNKKPKRNKV